MLPKEEITPGIHPQARHFKNFNDDEKAIAKFIGTEWLITKCGDFWLGQSEQNSSKYRYLLIKPTSNYQEMFNLDREIVVIFSDYENFEPRSLDAIDHVLKQHQRLRIDKICSVIISNDVKVEEKVKDLLRSDEEAQIIVPISYKAFTEAVADSYFLRNKFKEHFYTRDLFSFQGPLKKELYFFGRTELIHRIVSRHESNENAGLFGLRKSGKTSVIFGVERALEVKESKAVLIDCHDPAFHVRRWNEALWYVLYQIVKKYDINTKIEREEKFTEKNASLIFEKEITTISKVLGKNILLIFDEIENITFGISPSSHWSEGLDFVYFWQTLRSSYQRLKGVFSYLIVGTNPLCIERPRIQEKENPLFMSLPFEYIERFDVPQTRDMVRKLGRIMGLKIDETLYAKLTEDYGGHPFLMRHVCSIVNKISPQERPTTITRQVYEKAKAIFDQEYVGYIEMVLGVLQNFYKEEFDMLQFLALDDIDTFNAFARDTPQYTNHLLGYGLIEKYDGGYDFKIDSVKKYLVSLNKYKKATLSLEDKWREISERRNDIEPKIRKIIRTVLTANYGEAIAKNKILDIYGEKRKSEYSARTLKDILNPNIANVFFEDLRKIINKEWSVFKNIFGLDQDKFNASMKVINEHRDDAHSKEITDDEMSLVRVSFNQIEKQIHEYLE